jgi:hypothetical protein
MPLTPANLAPLGPRDGPTPRYLDPPVPVRVTIRWSRTDPTLTETVIGRALAWTPEAELKTGTLPAAVLVDFTASDILRRILWILAADVARLTPAEADDWRAGLRRMPAWLAARSLQGAEPAQDAERPGPGR